MADIRILIQAPAGGGKSSLATLLTKLLMGMGLSVVNRDDDHLAHDDIGLLGLYSLGKARKTVEITTECLAKGPLPDPTQMMHVIGTGKLKPMPKRPDKYIVGEHEVDLFFGRLSDGNIHAVVRFPNGSYESLTTLCQVKLSPDEMLVKSKWQTWCRVNGIGEDTMVGIAGLPGLVMRCFVPVA